MDRYGFLTLLQRVNLSCIDVHRQRTAEITRWGWDGVAVMYPESICTFCKHTIRSPFIWILRGEDQRQLIGAILPKSGNKVVIHRVEFPHMVTSEHFCLGSHNNGVSLLASPINLRGVSMSRQHVPKWIKKCFNNHVCQQMRDFITNDTDLEGYESRRQNLLRELDAPWSIS